MAVIYLDKGLVIAGPDTDVDGDLAERRCIRIDDDQAQRSKCPGGGQDILKSILRSLRFEVPTANYDPTYRTIVRTQDDGQGYGLSISNGSLTTERLEEKFIEKVEISPSDFISGDDWYKGPDYPVQIDLAGKTKFVPDTVLSANMSGSILDAEGDPVATPLAQRTGTILHLQYKVFADVTITYKATADASLVEVEPTNDPENNYQSQLLINSECGGLARFLVEVPECFESANRLLNGASWDDILAAFGLGDDTGGGGDAVTEYIKGADLERTTDVCSGETTERLSPK